MFARHGACTGAAICDDVFIVASLAEGLALAAELNQVLKQDLDLDLDVPKFNCFFPGDRINDDDHARALFFKMLCRPILSLYVCQAWMLASPRRGCVLQGYL